MSFSGPLLSGSFISGSEFYGTALEKFEPSLFLDFATSKSLDSRITFTRASSATYYDAQGTLQTAASGVPRFDHDPATGESLGLLVEEQRTNLLLRSEEFDDEYWTKLNTSVNANTIVAPDGTLTGDKLVESATNAQHDIRRPLVAVATSTTYTFSAYVKAAERNIILLQLFRVGVGTANGYFDLASKTVTLVNSSGGFTNVSASIVDVSNSWCRVSLTMTGDAATTTLTPVILLVSSGTTTVYTGDGTSGVYIWGAQLEAGAFPTSYIKTEGSQVTRSADAASMTGTNFSSWYRQDEGTIFAITQLTGYSSTSNPVLVRIANSASISNNNITMFVAGAGPNYRASITESGVGTFLQNVVTITDIYNAVPWAIAYKTNDAYSASRYFIGNPTDTAVTVPTTVNALYLDAGISVRKYIRKIAFYPKRLSNAQLQALTR